MAFLVQTVKSAWFDLKGNKKRFGKNDIKKKRKKVKSKIYCKRKNMKLYPDQYFGLDYLRG